MDDDKENKSERIEIIYKILYNLRVVDFNNFKDVFSLIIKCAYIIHLHGISLHTLISDVNNKHGNRPLINSIWSLIMNSFNLSNRRDVYYNICKFKILLNLNEEDLLEILKNVMEKNAMEIDSE